MNHLFIDAYNVICATDSLYQVMQGSLDAARDQLAELVRSIHDAEGIHVVLVLDSRQDSLQVEHPYKVKTFEFVYAPADVSADGVIERMVASVEKSVDTTVVRNDRMVRESVRANGALALRPEALLEWAQACEMRLLHEAHRRRNVNEKKFRNSIDFEL